MDGVDTPQNNNQPRDCGGYLEMPRHVHDGWSDECNVAMLFLFLPLLFLRVKEIISYSFSFSWSGSFRQFTKERSLHSPVTGYVISIHGGQI
jgi:hypothetical protein